MRVHRGSIHPYLGMDARVLCDLVLPHVLRNVADSRRFASGTEDIRVAIQHVPRWLVTQS